MSYARASARTSSRVVPRQSAYWTSGAADALEGDVARARASLARQPTGKW